MAWNYSALLGLDSGARHSPITSDHMPTFSHGNCGTCLDTLSRRGDWVIGYENEDRACILHICPLIDARAVTLPPPPSGIHYCKLSCLASRMATQQDVESHQIFLNACVLLDGL